MTTKPPGWYDDGRGALRWWDGTQWTEHVALPDAAASEVDDYEALPPELAGLDDDDAQGSSGAFSAATESRSSKLWIVWAVLGVLLLGVVIAAAVFIPLMFLNLATSGPGAEARTADEKAAVEVIEQYDQAWLEADCDAYMTTTTEEFRENERITDCPTFEESSALFDDSVENYTIAVTGVETRGSTVVVATRENYDSYLDEDGAIVEEPVPFEDRFTYVLVSSGDGWAIQSVGR